jgi:hypothetical protein
MPPYKELGLQRAVEAVESEASRPTAARQSGVSLSTLVNRLKGATSGKEVNDMLILSVEEEKELARWCCIQQRLG